MVSPPSFRHTQLDGVRKVVIPNIYPPAIKRGNGNLPINGGFDVKTSELNGEFSSKPTSDEIGGYSNQLLMIHTLKTQRCIILGMG